GDVARSVLAGAGALGVDEFDGVGGGETLAVGGDFAGAADGGDTLEPTIVGADLLDGHLGRVRSGRFPDAERYVLAGIDLEEHAIGEEAVLERWAGGIVVVGEQPGADDRVVGHGSLGAVLGASAQAR